MSEVKKTYKREVAFGMLLVMGALIGFDKVEMVSVIIYPLITFITVAFGMDAYSKQIAGK